jgi:hypothetical protein
MAEQQDRDAVVVATGIAQGGYIRTGDLLRAGFVRRSREQYERGGVLARVSRGLSLVVDLERPDVWDDRLRRACARVGGDVIVARETAARLHGIVGGPTLAAISLIIAANRRDPRLPGVDVKRCDVAPDDIGTLDGLAVTRPLRTVVDCARYSNRLTAVCLLESAARQDLVSLGDVARRLDDLHRAPYVQHAKERFELVDVRSESPLETAVRLPLLDAGLPYPEQLPFLCSGIAGRIDIAYPVELLGGRPGGRYVGLAIEADGREPHLQAETFHHDRARQTALEEAGWLVRRFTDHSLRSGPRYVVERTRRAIATVVS